MMQGKAELRAFKPYSRICATLKPCISPSDCRARTESSYHKSTPAAFKAFTCSKAYSTRTDSLAIFKHEHMNSPSCFAKWRARCSRLSVSSPVRLESTTSVGIKNAPLFWNAATSSGVGDRSMIECAKPSTPASSTMCVLS